MKTSSSFDLKHRSFLSILALSTLCLLPSARAGIPMDVLFEPAPIPGTSGESAFIPFLSAATPMQGFALDMAPTGLFPSAAPAATAKAGGARTGAVDSQQLEKSIAEYTRNIREREMNEGPYAMALGEDLLALGQLYLQESEHEKAIEALAKAEHITRVNYGLNSIEQFPAVELSIQSYLARKDYQMAIERQEYLVYLHQSRFGRDSVEVVPELVDLGNMYFDAFKRGLHHESGNMMLSYGPQSNFVDPRALNAFDTAFLWLRQAQFHYSTSISTLLTHEHYFDPRLLALENNLIATLFLQAHRRDLEQDADFFMSASHHNVRDVLSFDARLEKLPGYREGEKAFTRILTYLRNNPGVEPVQVAQAMIELGDWHILFGKQQMGMAKYQEARDYLREAGVDAKVIAGLLSPPVPVQLPTFMEQPNTLAPVASPDLAFDGYIDVAFTLNPLGQVGELEVLDKSPNADPSVEARLKKVLRNAPFRPRVALGDVSPAEKVAVRYNFTRVEGSGG